MTLGMTVGMIHNIRMKKCGPLHSDTHHNNKMEQHIFKKFSFSSEGTTHSALQLKT